LKQLTALYLCTQIGASDSLTEITKPCLRLTKVYLSNYNDIDVDDFTEFLKLIPNLDTLYLEEQSFFKYTDYSFSESLSTVVRVLSNTNHDLRKLVLRAVELPVILPQISTSCFPTLRVLDIQSRTGETRGERGHVKSGHTINPSEFLQSFRALEILHIGAQNCILHGNGGMVWNVLPRTVKIFTVRDEDFQIFG
jgi:hypothetical protein